MKFQNNEVQNNERTPVLYGLGYALGYPLEYDLGCGTWVRVKG